MRWFRQSLEEHRSLLHTVLRRYLGADQPFLLQSDLWDAFEAAAQDEDSRALATTSPMRRFIRSAQEAVIDAPFVCFALRPRIAEWVYLRVEGDALEAESISASEYLQSKERVIGRGPDSWLLEVDLAPFNRDFPKPKEPRSIGRGVEFLNRNLSSRLFVNIDKGDRRLLEFLQVHQYRGTQLMLNRRIGSVASLREAIAEAIGQLANLAPDTPWEDFRQDLQTLGFEPGWGRSAERTIESLELLAEILEAPEPGNLERFLGRVPMIFTLAILSPHGYFGQSGVLGRPDTGGQIVYILDQVRALEREMRARLVDQGLDIDPQIVIVTRLIPEADGTTCDQPLEAIAGTDNVAILRIPFRDDDGRVVPHWISRFKVWPYLERFAEEAQVGIVAHLSGRPDLIVGNYSDGNLVASLLSRKLGVTQCNIAHALEKTKYLLSDLYWEDNDEEYHFACQFTADLVAMNTADFIITSTYQEIAGTDDSIGQYEAYGSYTLPGLYRVLHGADPLDPRFNIVSPGADAEVYFPNSEADRRLPGLHGELEELVSGPASAGYARGELENPDKPIIFSMARLDRIKNISGLTEWYARDTELRELANLVLVAGHVDPNASNDAEEIEQIHHMHRLMDEHHLDGCVRWVGTRLEKSASGELYRWIADRGGIFVQPALFEAFGLTVIEAMVSGLPTFATRYGGPLEIIEDGRSGFHIDPNHGDLVAESIREFFLRCRDDSTYWNTVSAAGVDRVRARYTWELYADRMMTLARVYGFWKYVTDLEREETRRYVEMLYALQYRPLARAVPK